MFSGGNVLSFSFVARVYLVSQWGLSVLLKGENCCMVHGENEIGGNYLSLISCSNYLKVYDWLAWCSIDVCSNFCFSFCNNLCFSFLFYRSWLYQHFSSHSTWHTKKYGVLKPRYSSQCVFNYCWLKNVCVCWSNFRAHFLTRIIKKWAYMYNDRGFQVVQLDWVYSIKHWLSQRQNHSSLFFVRQKSYKSASVNLV